MPMDVTVPGSRRGRNKKRDDRAAARDCHRRRGCDAARDSEGTPLPALRPSADRAEGCNDEDKGGSAVDEEEVRRGGST